MGRRNPALANVRQDSIRDPDKVLRNVYKKKYLEQTA